MVILIAVIVLTLIIWAGLWFAAGKAGVSKRDKASAMLVTVGITGLWLTASIILGNACFFCAQTDRFPKIPIALLVFVVVAAGIFMAPLTHRVLGAVPTWLLAFQTFRTIGINLLMGYFNGTLPALFAIPIGVGDVAIGVAAPLVAYGYAKQKSWGRAAAIWFNIIGLLVIFFSGSVVVFSQSSTIQLFTLYPSTDLVTHYPIILEAVYGMPTVVFIHLFSLHYTWKAPTTPQPV
jgi:NADH:ubiquinone oxidoreductase subunit K